MRLFQDSKYNLLVFVLFATLAMAFLKFWKF